MPSFTRGHAAGGAALDQNYHSRIRSDVIPHIPRGGRLIDVGGGTGATASALKTAGHADRIGVIDRVPPAPGAALDFAYSGDLADPALLDRAAREEGPFDTILCLDVLEHLADPWAMVARLHAMLAPGGAIVASVPNVRHYSVLLPLLLAGRWDYEDAGILDRTHLRFFTRDSAVALMISSGLRLDGVAANPLQRRRDIALHRASLGIGEGLLALQYIIRVRRDR